jgi:RNA polymerase sigma-70 factor, ECF subfamily
LFFQKKTSFSNLEEVIDACLSDNNYAQRAMIKLFLGYAKSICLRYAANQEEAEEMVNDGFLKVFTNLKKYDRNQSFKAWLRTVFVNNAIDYYRKNQKFNSQTSGIENVEVESFDVDIISKISGEEILALVQRLSPVYKMVFTMYVIEGYNHREIAEKLGIQEGTSKSNLRDARQRLQAMIRKEFPHLYQIYALKITKLNEN